MTYENEQKYRITSPLAVRKTLRRLGAKLLHQGREENELYDFKGHLKRQKKLLRLRRYDGGKGLLTLKGPRLGRKFKKRLELETSVDFKASRWILKELGYSLSCTYEKTREEYLYKGAHICLDHLKKLGWFVEIEGRPKAILETAKALGLNPKDEEHKTYLELLGVKR